VIINAAAVLKIQRQMTIDFIATDPTVISLIPTVKTKLPNGAWSEVDGTPRAPQTFKLIPVDFTAHGQSLTVMQDGVERIISYYLLGAYDAVIEPGDHWVNADGRRCVVISMMDTHGYEQKATVEAHG
jgi:hypothetical protein